MPKKAKFVAIRYFNFRVQHWQLPSLDTYGFVWPDWFLAWIYHETRKIKNRVGSFLKIGPFCILQIIFVNIIPITSLFPFLAFHRRILSLNVSEITTIAYTVAHKFTKNSLFQIKLREKFISFSPKFFGHIFNEFSLRRITAWVK